VGFRPPSLHVKSCSEWWHSQSATRHSHGI